MHLTHNRIIMPNHLAITTSWSRLGHHTYNLARDFMRTIPIWFKWNSSLIFGRNHCSGATKDAAIFNGKLVLVIAINLQLIWNALFRWPTMQNVIPHMRENGIPMCGLADLWHSDWSLFHLNMVKVSATLQDHPSTDCYSVFIFLNI